MKKAVVIILLFLVTLLLSSCEDGCEKELKLVSRKEKPPVVLLNETTKIDAGNHRAWGIYVSVDHAMNATLHIEVKSNLDLNVWLVSGNEYSHLKRGESFSYFPTASRQRVIEFTCDFPVRLPGYYYLVLDNRFSIFTSKTASVKVTRSEGIL